MELTLFNGLILSTESAICEPIGATVTGVERASGERGLGYDATHSGRAESPRFTHP